MSKKTLFIVLTLTFALTGFGQRKTVDLSAQKLIACLETDQVTGSACKVSVDDIKDELRRRAPVQTLIAGYQKSHDDFQRKNLLDVLYQIQNKTVSRFMRRRLTRRKTEAGYFYANYLAKTGERRALRILNDNYAEYPVSSAQWATSVRLFGKYKFRSAVDNLIDSLDAASLNVVESALESLREIFSAPAVKFNSPAEAKKYFIDRKSQYHRRLRGGSSQMFRKNIKLSNN